MGGVDLDRAQMVIEGRTPDGRTMQVWKAPNDSGGACLHTRYVTDDGAAEPGDTECWSGRHTEPLESLPLWTGGGTSVVPGYVTTYGRATVPAAASLRIIESDGTRHTVRLKPDGTFLTFTRQQDETAFERRTIEVLDARGKVLYTDPYG
ncbi:hypothetical protein RB200_29875 [Streptomyces sp. PmtG]